MKTPQPARRNPIDPLHLAALAFLASCLLSTAVAGRQTLSLDGRWEVEESLSGTAPPAVFGHRAPVPGLANLARPAFLDVDLFNSKELISNRIRKGVLTESDRPSGQGVSRQSRNYFWYRTTFRAPKPRAAAILRINKAQFGTQVWLNDRKVGDYSGCFTAGVFDIADAVHWAGENTLVVRIGAHPGVLPANYPAGSDFEKLKWTPGIYDSVSLAFCDNPVIESVQVAPRIDASEIVVQTRVKSRGAASSATVRHVVRPWKGRGEVATSEPETVSLASGEEKVITQTVKIPGAKLWSPEEPNLYVVETTTDGDSLSTRFGMREFRSDAGTKRFYLNGKVYYLRGSNITLHRFFEDPDCGDLPWNERWVRRLLVELPGQMHWNSFRFCIGPVPDKWLEIADEAGLLIQNEFFIWTGAPSWDTNYNRGYDVPEMIRQYSDWVRDNANHPSVAIWDANNESQDPVFGKEIIPAARKLDLSNRPWENSYNPPAGPDDPVEYHPYLFYATASSGEVKFRLSDLETRNPAPDIWHFKDANRPILINEYGWLWLNRDGTPTLLTDKLYPAVLGSALAADERFTFNAYALAAMTEYWRASREYAGVLHFVYLTCSYPGVFTSDHFLDVKKLRLEPHFAGYVSEAFKPLGVFLRFLQPRLEGGTQRAFPVVLINDEPRPVAGRLTLTLQGLDGAVVVQAETEFRLESLGREELELTLDIPDVARQCLLVAAAKEGADGAQPTLSRRQVMVTSVHEPALLKEWPMK